MAKRLLRLLIGILTTPEGANLPATASEEGFPLLVPLHKDWFDFSQAKTNGDDIRFASANGIAVLTFCEVPLLPAQPTNKT